jgi:hypothetical protein
MIKVDVKIKNDKHLGKCVLLYVIFYVMIVLMQLSTTKQKGHMNVHTRFAYAAITMPRKKPLKQSRQTGQHICLQGERKCKTDSPPSSKSFAR